MLIKPERMFTIPAPSIVNRSKFPSAVDEEILNLPLSLRSMPSVKVEVAYPPVLVATNRISASPGFRGFEEIARRLLMEVVARPTLPLKSATPLKNEVEDALNAPATWRDWMELEALLMKPPWRRVRPAMAAELDAERGPETLRLAAMVDEAPETKPPLS